MSIVIFLLAVIVLAGVVLAAELLRPAAAPRRLDPALLQADQSFYASYEPMRRLFSEQDIESLRRAGRLDLASKLFQSRRRVMRIYLRRLRSDYLRLWSICRLLTPITEEEGFTSRLIRQYVRFHMLYAAIEIRCALGLFANSNQDIERLTELLAQMKHETAGLLRPNAAAPLSSTV